LLIYPCAILFLHGLPDWLVSTVTGRPSLRLPLSLLTHPIICGLIYVTVMSCWHFPFLYDWALQNRTVHIIEHFSMFGAALFLWWPLYSPSKEFPPKAYAWHLFYLLGITIGMTPAFAYITFASDVLYPTYEFAPRITALSAMEDQRLAGSMMKLVGMTVMMGAFAISFYRWYQRTESRQGKV
jgi:putative membrane protein